MTVSYLIGKALGYGLTFAGIMLIISGITSFTSYYYSDKFVLSISSAKKADKGEYPDLYRAVENISIAAGLPLPRIFVMYDITPNAFATGRDPRHSAICVTTGLLDKLKFVELEAIIAHEMSHIRNFDTRLMGVVSVLVGSIAILSDIFLRNAFIDRVSNKGSKNNRIIFFIAIVVAIISPILATLMQLALSRRREYLADADGVLLTRYPEGLAKALEKIHAYNGSVKNASLATAHFYIEDPFGESEKRNWIFNLFSTHPPIQERVRILRSM